MSANEQRPSVGRIVHWRRHLADEPSAALVVIAYVSGGTHLVDLAVWHPGSSLPEYITRVPHDDARADGDAGGWSWPPRT